MSRPRRIVWVIPRIDPEAGGPSSTAVNAVIAEARHGSDVTLAFTRAEGPGDTTGPAIDRMRAEGVRVVAFSRSVPGSKAASWGISLPLFRWLFRNASAFDVIHVQYVWAATTIAAALAARVRRRPVVMTPHESLTSYDIDLTSGNRLKRLAKLAFRGVVLRGIDVIAYSSDLERRESSVPAHRGIVLPHAVADICPDLPLEEPGDRPIVLGFLGRIHPKKNLDLILLALAALDHGGFRLIVAGGGPAELVEELERQATDLGIADRIEWRGRVDETERAAFFEDIHLLLMPSEFECFGMVAAEAMSVGVPAIVSRSTGVAGLIEESAAGIVVDDPTPERLAAAIERLSADHATRARLRQASLEVTRERLSFAAYATGSDRLYETLRTG
jgi:glycosyltransferase involved in cell wall biosynthesis